MNDSAGAVISKSFFGLSGEPRATTFGYARIEFDRDVYGRPVQIRYLAPGGSPVRRSNQLFSNDVLVNDGDLVDLLGEWRNLALSAFLSPEQISAVAQSGFATVTQRFDEAGHIVERAYWGPDGRAVPGPSGLQVERYAYDVYDRLSEIGFGGVGPTGITTITLGYGAPSQVSRIAFLDRHHKPVASGSGIFGYELQYDAAGTLVSAAPIEHRP